MLLSFSGFSSWSRLTSLHITPQRRGPCGFFSKGRDAGHVQRRTAERIRPYVSFTSKRERYGPPSPPLHPKIQGTSHPFNLIQVPHLPHSPRYEHKTNINSYLSQKQTLAHAQPNTTIVVVSGKWFDPHLLFSIHAPFCPLLVFKTSAF